MKKLLALLLCVIMVVTIFAGCGPTDTPDDTKGSDTAGVGDTLPEDITLTIGIPAHGKVEDYDTNAYTLWLEEQTGYNLEFRLYQGMQADYKSQLSVAMVDGEKLPDILINFDLGAGVYEEYGVDGYFIDLTPYFEDKEKSQIWWDRFEQFDEKYQNYVWNKMQAGEDGGIYAYPRLESTPYDVMESQCFINQEWLTKLGLPMPTDRESLYNTLVAFRDRDPNGNGKKDEIPLLGIAGYAYGNSVAWLCNMFMYYDDDNFWRVDDNGELYHTYASDEYREALCFINKLVKEGLMPDSCWSMNSSSLKSIICPGDGVETVGIWMGHPTTATATNHESLLAYEAMPYWGYVNVNRSANSYDTFITEDCEYPDAAWNLLMLMASEESSYRQRYGEKGVDWVEADAGTESFLGLPATIKILNEGAFTDIGNQTWGRISATILHNAENEACQLDENMNEWLQHKMKIMRDCYDNYYAANERTPDSVVQTLVYTPEEEEYIAVWMDNTKGWIRQCQASFCCGTGDLNDPNNDAQWATYVAGIEQQGVDQWREVAQEVYDWQYAGK